MTERSGHSSQRAGKVLSPIYLKGEENRETTSCSCPRCLESPQGGGCSLGSVFMLIDASIGINEPRTYRASNCFSLRRQMQSATEFSNVTYDSATVGKEGTFQGLWGGGCTWVAPATDPNCIHMAAHHRVKHWDINRDLRAASHKLLPLIKRGREKMLELLHKLISWGGTQIRFQIHLTVGEKKIATLMEKSSSLF